MGKIEQERCIGADYDTDSCLIIIGNGFDLYHGLSTSYTWKNIEGNYDALNHFLDTLANVNTVIIMGNSFDKVDMPYYHDVLAPRYRDAEWVFCEYDPNENKQCDIDIFCRELAIPNYRMISYMEFDIGYDQSIDRV